MKSKKDMELALNQERTPLVVFLDSYNKSIPEHFPQASVKVLKRFKDAYPALFKHGDEWSIDRHRKKLMDWLSSYREA